ncbi:MAG: class I SAM-dependent methyltransferase [Candidatus Heimdallarchaeota archaeon]|nr:MAG: class I SAM-dependent methyltransferase [Candidatus Heimdallarchaeota archaeon]
MKEVNISYPISQIQYTKPRRKKLKERLNFGIMYQHPRIYDFTIWLNDPSGLMPKTLAKSIVGNSVLDLGCGTANLQTFLPNGVQYIGVDLNEDFLVFADKKSRGTFYKRDVIGDLSDLKADTVVLADVLHHVTPNHQKLIENAINCARKKIVISACYEKEEGPFKQISEFIGRRIIDNDGLNGQREGAGWLKLDELLQFLVKNGATNFQKVLSHIHCEINK